MQREKFSLSLCVLRRSPVLSQGTHHYEQIEAVLGFQIDHSFLTYKKEAAGFGYMVGKISMKEKHIAFDKLDGAGK
jgi:hypothetical protein